MAKCLVLGANGFIGSHLVDELVENGYDVRAFGRFQSEIKFKNNSRIEVFSGDYLNRSDLEAALIGVDYVFHFISTTTPATSDNEPRIDIETNIHTSVELFQLCVAANVKRVIYASSGGAIYGGNDSIGSYKETDLTLPVSPYAIGKLTVENYLRYFRVKYGLHYTIFRIANPYGERQPFWRKQGVIPIFLEKVHNKEPLTVLGDGSMVRDYIYVKDAVKMIVSTLAVEPKEDVYNLGSGHGYSVNELIDSIESVTGAKVAYSSEPVPSTFIHKVVLNTERFTDEFKIQPETSLKDGMLLTYRYIQHELNKRRK